MLRFHAFFEYTKWITCLFFFASFQTGNAATHYYAFGNDLIDVVIPSTYKDIDTLECCINGIKENGKNVRRIIVVSPEKLTDQAEWFDEKLFPFTISDVSLKLHEKSVPDFMLGWHYQQLLKLYAAFVIPNISSNVLILDSDTIFLNPVDFINYTGGGLYNPGSEYVVPYFEHAQRLLPGFHKIFPRYSGISHHMLFQKPVLEDIFNDIRKNHETEPWIAFCDCIAQNEKYGFSEYEIYFNYVFARTDQVMIRSLKWLNTSQVSELQNFKDAGYHYVSCHAYLRNP
jgi:hypothetical protein